MIMVLAVIKLGLIFALPGQQSQTEGEPVTQKAPVMETRLAMAAPGDNNNDGDDEDVEEVDEEDIPGEVQRLREREAELDRRERNLRDLEEELDAKLEELRGLQAEVDEMLKEADVVRDEKIAHLVDVYSNMEPPQAAQVLETLNEDIAVKVLAGMRGREAGDILTNVNPQKAARLSEMLTDLQLPFIEQ
ncbi:hypothetical protein [Desulfonatronospira sp. MSAO_Bac3]|uniref:MotE family protein n=1 Tax=Desulfonatronospira sp. MSAO_Bac3 TaxID=2293857 RepID=UPI000FEEB605|nr:hypothetical protein [Desulfonatronospira sp. MSAO_Bac3]RQD79062.1 MAG: hypothetical protein D5S03_01090 [Desulfonatronospira sp. MSAO_Bac3]